ncbi:hypothetical protein NDU88_002157 [Pleurodeles waltl]|uniref:Uncharacterized protein n=1 Tax=Pleurodeles waltl TaxID=8319 RepID=A0AAV7TJS9_PLEWA|nr:hypothetical protein NDU88_002157 [Pleurodeles waltl]
MLWAVGRGGHPGSRDRAAVTAPGSEARNREPSKWRRPAQAEPRLANWLSSPLEGRGAEPPCCNQGWCLPGTRRGEVWPLRYAPPPRTRRRRAAGPAGAASGPRGASDTRGGAANKTQWCRRAGALEPSKRQRIKTCRGARAAPARPLHARSWGGPCLEEEAEDLLSTVGPGLLWQVGGGGWGWREPLFFPPGPPPRWRHLLWCRCLAEGQIRALLSAVLRSGRLCLGGSTSVGAHPSRRSGGLTHHLEWRHAETENTGECPTLDSGRRGRRGTRIRLGTGPHWPGHLAVSLAPTHVATTCLRRRPLWVTDISE